MLCPPQTIAIEWALVNWPLKDETLLSSFQTACVHSAYRAHARACSNARTGSIVKILTSCLSLFIIQMFMDIFVHFFKEHFYTEAQHSREMKTELLFHI